MLMGEMPRAQTCLGGRQRCPDLEQVRDSRERVLPCVYGKTAMNLSKRAGAAGLVFCLAVPGGCSRDCVAGYERSTEGYCVHDGSLDPTVDTDRSTTPGTVALDAVLSVLTAQDWEQICAATVDPGGTDRVVDCGGATGTISIAAPTLASCLDAGAALVSADCTATVLDWLECNGEPDLTDDQICGVATYLPSAACARVADCADPP